MDIYSKLRQDAEHIARGAVAAVMPDNAVQRALKNISFLGGNIYLVAVGKAAWQMADAAVKHLDVPIKDGIVLTKYDHVKGDIPNVRCYEAGHPVPDKNSYFGTEKVLEMTKELSAQDTVLFLLSGGGSALFEKPLVAPEKVQNTTQKLLSCGADIVQINTLRKRLSGVKGGRFAQWCASAQVEAIILSDILGDPVDMIASGPAAADTSTSEQALSIAAACGITDPEVLALLSQETPKDITNVNTQIIGSVRELCRAAEKLATDLGYEAIYLTDHLDCEASQAGAYLAKELKKYQHSNRKVALLAGGETVVTLRGNGLGGRNQELALSAAAALSQIPNAAIISVGSDGTDGPTDAAGGYADTQTLDSLREKGLDYAQMLGNNDSYHALKAIDSLIFTGPTGTNVNDVTVALIIGTDI